jgi:hypothetical protein
LSIGPLPYRGHDADHTENTSSNTLYIVGCAYSERYQETGTHVTLYIKGGFITIFKMPDIDCLISCISIILINIINSEKPKM